MKGPIIETCYLCKSAATTRDHVPPRCVFPIPRPSNLITVPACHDCNTASKLDDEYFRWIVATGSPGHPAADQLTHRISKRFKESPAFFASIMQQRKSVDVLSDGGIFLEQRVGFEFDGARANRIIEKIVRGLYFHHIGQKLPETEAVEKYIFNPKFSPDHVKTIQQLPLHDIGDSVFSYRYYVFKEERESYWLLMFFDRLLFMSKTCDIGVLPSECAPET